MMPRFTRTATRTLAIGVAAAALTVGAAATPGQGSPQDHRARGAHEHPPAAAATATFTPEADTYAAAASPTRNYGKLPQLRADAATAKRIYLRFVVKGLAERIVSAKLRLHVTNSADGPSPDGGSFRLIEDITWSETALTWNNQPSTSESVPLGAVGAVARSTWVELDVTGKITRGGRHSILVTSADPNFVEYDSRETDFAPQLVVTTGTLPPPDQAHVLVGAGDIAGDGSGDSKTADLIRAMPNATVYTVGDNAYPDGRASDFESYYEPTWGAFKERTRPSPGNHDYNSNGADPYYAYFGSLAGPPGLGYYSYELGNWHIVSLNSERSMNTGSTQNNWLLQDLANSTKPCTLAYWHKPLFTSAESHGPATETRPLFQALYDHGAEVVVAAHNHNYERFAPQTPQGELDNARGIRQFVAGMGGKSHYKFGDIADHSEARNANTYGVLKFTLRPSGYDWEFVPEAGMTYTDAGSGACH